MSDSPLELVEAINEAWTAAELLGRSLWLGLQ